MHRPISPAEWLKCILSVAAAFSACSSAMADETIVLTGASTVAPLVAEIGKRFEALHPGVRVDVQTGGSSRGIRDSRKGLADIGMVSRPLNDNEHDLKAYTIALDGVTMIVHRSNPVTALSRQQIIDIYTGKISDWSQVGPGSGAILVENKAEGRSTLDLFLEHFKLKSPDIRAAVVVGDNQEAIKVVSGNPRAIGYVSIGAAISEAAVGTPIKALPLDGVEPTIDAVMRRKFPLMRELNLVVRQTPEGNVKNFIAYAGSEQATDLVKELFFVPARQ
jgi:phosphate transport system substrate-binding protein